MNNQNEMRARIKGVGKLKVAYRKNGSTEHTFRRKVMTNGIIDTDRLCAEAGIDPKIGQKLMRTAVRVLRAGYEVRLGLDRENAVRLIPFLEKDMTTLFVGSQTIGPNFRECISDLEWVGVRNGKEQKDGDVQDEMKDLIKANGRNKRVCITPDTVITCNVCGNEIRVGKYLADRK